MTNAAWKRYLDWLEREAFRRQVVDEQRHAMEEARRRVSETTTGTTEWGDPPPGG